MPLQSRHPLAEAGAPSLERRVRRPVSLSGCATRADGSVVELTLTDLSYDGCAVDCPTEFVASERVRLSVNRRGSIGATVRWASANKAGLAFDCDDRADLTPAARRHERIDIGAKVILRRLGKLGFQVRLFDLSPVGCKAEFLERPELGEQVRITFDDLDSLAGRVCWVAGTKAGIRFGQPIQEAVYALLLERLGSGSER